MSLPILVPQPHELALLGLRMWPAPTQRRFRWRLSVHLYSQPAKGRHTRHERPRAPGSAALRDDLLRHWRQRCAVWPQPLLPRPMEWCSETYSDFRTLLSDAESVLKALMRRRRSTEGVHARSLTALAKTFDIQRWRLHVDVAQHKTLAVLLCTMYWRGFRNPANITAAPRHPSTGLVRWLSRFTVRQQLDHGRQILHALAAEEARAHAFALQLARRMVPMRGPTPRRVTLLPDLLKCPEPSCRRFATLLLLLPMKRRGQAVS